MARKKKNKKEEIELEPIIVEPEVQKAYTVEIATQEGYMFLKEKGENLIYTKASRRISIPK